MCCKCFTLAGLYYELCKSNAKQELCFQKAYEFVKAGFEKKDMTKALSGTERQSEDHSSKEGGDRQQSLNGTVSNPSEFLQFKSWFNY